MQTRIAARVLGYQIKLIIRVNNAEIKLIIRHAQLIRRFKNLKSCFYRQQKRHLEGYYRNLL